VTAQPANVRRPRAGRTALVLLAAALVAVALGVYGKVHEPTGRPLFPTGSAEMIATKAALSTVVLAGALIQLGLALRLYGRLGSTPVPGWVGRTHRIVGAVTFLASLPVAAQCLWALGYQGYDVRVAVHSLLGCLLYGAFVTKILGLHVPGLPGWLVPWAGGTLFALVVALWLTSALWYYTSEGFPGF
jgi:hypothetical protein